MSEEDRNTVPPEEASTPSETPTPEQSEELLSGKLASAAEEVTSGLRDMLPEQTPAAPAEQPPVETVPPESQPVEPSAGPVIEEAQPVPPTKKAAPSISALESLKGTTSKAMESTSDDRLMSMLAWLTMVVLQLPIVSVIQLLSASTRERLFQRHHAVTSLLFYGAAIVYEILAGIVYAVLGTVTLGCGFACLWVIFFVPHALALYYALQAYNGKLLELPFLSNFGRQQGWL